ncbi:50S ribosomal protein L25 [Candidatus Jorgensenbacteria bacterium]|nr:50S ribosomal protein L25 [Candidatus Jorgensenbacteria bacterium]
MELQVKTRTVLGKKVKHLRREGFIPGEVFGHGVPNKHVSVNAKDFNKLYRKAGEHTVIKLMADDGITVPVLISDVTEDTLNNRILSVDFHQIRMDEKIKTKIPIEFTGTAPAIKKGLIIVKVMSEVEVESLPGKIPHSLVIDLSHLEELGQSILAKDLSVPPDVKMFLPIEMVIATVSQRAKEEVVTPPPTSTAATEAEPVAAGTESSTAKTTNTS